MSNPLSAAEKGELFHPHADTTTNDQVREKIKTPLYADNQSQWFDNEPEWLNGERWRYRVILAVNLLMIIGGQYAFLWQVAASILD